MENFLTTDIEDRVATTSLRSFRRIYAIDHRSAIKYWLIGLFASLFIVALLPWTQNIRARGTVTTRRQEQRPQELNTIIAGRVIKWNIKEGDFVNKGDTIMQLGEVKVDYFDPNLLARTRDQINAKEQSIDSYNRKARTAEVQMAALKESMDLKMQQIDNKLRQQKLKVQSDSNDVIAVINELRVALRQIGAAKIMLDSGAIALIDYEKRNITYQNNLAKRTIAENKLMQSRQELLTLKLERNATIQEYTDKISKADGDKFASLSSAASTDAEVAKLENQYSSYDIRNGLYYIVAPQAGQVIKAKKAGIGEIVKEGDMIVEIVPNHVQYSVEMYVAPMDLPLLALGQKVRFIFDGFPAIVFAGWPKSSYGTFGGKVSAIETSVSVNGKFRVLVVEDSTERKWPRLLKMGGGAQAIVLLKTVPIYYELWRNISGFPPDYYHNEENKHHTKEAKGSTY